MEICNDTEIRNNGNNTCYSYMFSVFTEIVTERKKKLLHLTFSNDQEK